MNGAAMQASLLLLKRESTFSFPDDARKLVPLYKLRHQTRLQPQTRPEGQRESSSPVCYAHLKDLREGFEGY
ncbi:hypothetical protein [Pontibacter roseus]|uniref:hypothetical protein n=1 Tax=Pontibacter roseus TaxID=336989 RepID=UPI00036D5705|nr:hypothetical protein [Pontibacter roseus]